MLIRLLDITVYGETGWGWHTEDVRNPTWDDIEEAIRRLDRFRYPFVMLYREASAHEDPWPWDCTVVGGEGELAVDCLADGRAYRLCDPSHGDADIEIWRSDQGATFEARYCFPIETALQATRYYCEHGALDPGLTWEQYPWSL